MGPKIDREDAIDSFDLSYVHEKLVNEGKFTLEELRSIDYEFRRFLKLVLSDKGPLAMVDRRVDELWHSFILFTPQYEEFCEKVMGFFVHHQPRTSKTPVPVGAIANFVEAYGRRFGELTPFWLEQLEPTTKAAITSGSVPRSLAFEWSGWTGRPGDPGTPS